MNGGILMRLIAINH